MKPIAYNVYVLMMFLAYVMRRAGTFSIEEHEGGATLLGEAMRCQPSQVDHLLALSQASKSPVHNLHP